MSDWTAAVHVDVTVITAPFQELWNVMFGLQHCVAAVLYVCVCLSNSVFLILIFRALLCELHGVGSSYLFLLQRDGHGISSSREGALILSLL